MRNSGGHGKILAWGRAEIIEDLETWMKEKVDIMGQGLGLEILIYFSLFLHYIL